jgi:hypothetical protein
VEGIWNTEPPYLLLNKWGAKGREKKRRKRETAWDLSWVSLAGWLIAKMRGAPDSR